MATYRAAKSGLARESQEKINRSFDIDEAKKCLKWICSTSGETIEINGIEERDKMMTFFHTTLKDGMVLCRLIDALLLPQDKIDFNSKSFQETKLPAFQSARERERIGIFLNKAKAYGVSEANIFQTDNLYERTNLVQVCNTIRALGIEAQTKPGYSGEMIWPKKSEENRRTFTEDQLKAGQQIISLQYGTNKGASQAGMNFGKQRKILD
ncbi:myophilin-like [Mytilus trossulus]|uniref:myophilin-like n=1 Tax=Mytilus trossulus TaxID=6551 RepID=UPI0030064EB1